MTILGYILPILSLSYHWCNLVTKVRILSNDAALAFGVATSQLMRSSLPVTTVTCVIVSGEKKSCGFQSCMSTPLSINDSGWLTCN